MKTKKVKKLQLNRESLRLLEQGLLNGVAGGITMLCSREEFSTCPLVSICFC
jgi:hypothetical protein